MEYISGENLELDLERLMGSVGVFFHRLEIRRERRVVVCCYLSVRTERWIWGKSWSVDGH